MRKIGLIFYRQCVMSHNSSVWFAVISEKLKELFLKILLLQVIFILGKAKAFLVGTRMSNGQEILLHHCSRVFIHNYFWLLPRSGLLAVCVCVGVSVSVSTGPWKSQRGGAEGESPGQTEGTVWQCRPYKSRPHVLCKSGCCMLVLHSALMSNDLLSKRTVWCWFSFEKTTF